MADYRFLQSDADAFVNSEVLKQYQAKIAKIARAFQEMGQLEASACEALAEKCLASDAERQARLEQDLADEEEITKELQEEIAEIAGEIEVWFPFTIGAAEQDRNDYVLAFLEYFESRKKVQ